MRWCWSLVLTSAFIVSAPSAHSTTWYVDPAGSGDFTLIQDAVNAAAARDTIILARGVHEVGGIGLEIWGYEHAASLFITGEGTHDETTIISRVSSSIIRCSYTTPEMTIANVTVGDIAEAPYAAYAIIIDGGTLVLRDCFVEGGRAINLSVGALIARGCTVTATDGEFALQTDQSSSIALQGCDFVGGSRCLDLRASGSIDSCSIAGGVVGIDHNVGDILSVTNTRITGCSAVAVTGQSVELVSCVIEQNGPDWGDGVLELGGNSTVRNCTVVRNRVDSENDPGKSVLHVNARAQDVLIENNIVAFNEAVDIRTLSPSVTVTCNLFWQNADLSHLGIFELDPSNIIADPLFCGFENGDYTLQADSPAAPLNSYLGCGPIGAFGVGCGEPATIPPATAGRVTLRAYPNPFNPVTRLVLAFDPVAGPVDLRVLDVSGRTVRRLTAGSTSVAAPVYWDGRDDVGRPAGSGVYFARLETDGQVAVTKVVVSR